MLPGMARAYAGGREHTLEAMSENKPVNLDGVLADIREHWSPRTIAVVNDYDARVVKVRGEFTRHTHPGTDEFFLVLSGRLTIRMDHGDVVLSKGDVYVVPAAVLTNLVPRSRPPCCCSSRATPSILAIRRAR